MTSIPQYQTLEQLEQKYESVLNTIQQWGVRWSDVMAQDGKLFVKGEAPSEQVRDFVNDQITMYSDLICEIGVNPSLASDSDGAGSVIGGMQTQPFQKILEDE